MPYWNAYIKNLNWQEAINWSLNYARAYAADESENSEVLTFPANIVNSDTLNEMHQLTIAVIHILSIVTYKFRVLAFIQWSNIEQSRIEFFHIIESQHIFFLFLRFNSRNFTFRSFKIILSIFPRLSFVLIYFANLS